MTFRLRTAVHAFKRLVLSFGTVFLALAALAWCAVVAVTSLVGVGLLLVPFAARAVRAVADRERRRLGILGPVQPPGGLRDPSLWRELAWVGQHATLGFVISLIGLTAPFSALQDLSYPLWWRAVPDEGAPGLAWWEIHSQVEALAVALIGLGWLFVALYGSPLLVRLQAWLAGRLLAPPPGTDLSLRIAELTATRAAALDAHAAELRRIERSLHDGAQNRLVAVNVLLGAARRAVSRDPATAGELLDRAQDATEQALAELRTVVRGILPPVLDGRGLDGALDSLAADCGVPCRLDVDLPGRCAASVEATAYFVVAEALTNITKHSGAKSASVAVRQENSRLIVVVEDDGRGGADETSGSGITGIRRRVEAYDGTLILTSPAGGPTRMRVELPCGS